MSFCTLCHGVKVIWRLGGGVCKSVMGVITEKKTTGNIYRIVNMQGKNEQQGTHMHREAAVETVHCPKSTGRKECIDQPQ